MNPENMALIKILFFIETLTGGGAEKVLCELVNHMDQHKFDITVQTVWPCDASKYLVPGIHYKTMYTSVNRVTHLLYRLEAECRLAYRQHIKDDYDIECAYLEMGPTKVLMASTNKRAKRLAWVHCDLSRAIQNPEIYSRKTAPWYAKYDEVICVSNSVKKAFDELYHNRFNSRVLYNVIDDLEIRKKAAQPLPENVREHGLIMLAAGRLTGAKNYMCLLRVHKRLLEAGIKHDLWILGDGPDRPKMEKYITENNLQNTVYMPGFIENPYPYLCKADLLVCSSVYEGFSTFMTEGVILGKPIVTTNVSGMRELLGDSEYGLIVENNEDDIYNGLKRMLENRSLRESFALKARERGVYFSGKRIVKETEQFFSELIQSLPCSMRSNI